MTIEAIASAVYNNTVTGLAGITSNPKISVEQLQDKSVVEQQMHLSETKINALINSGAMAISDVFNSGKYNGINTFCMAMPVRQKVYSIRLTRLCIILKRMVKVRHIYHKNREY